jgi:hypothetical protein
LEAFLELYGLEKEATILPGEEDMSVLEDLAWNNCGRNTTPKREALIIV